MLIQIRGAQEVLRRIEVRTKKRGALKCCDLRYGPNLMGTPILVH